MVRRDSVFTLAGLRTLLDSTGSRRHSLAHKPAPDQLTEQQAEAVNQLRELLQERQRLAAHREPPSATFAPPARDSGVSVYLSSTEGEDTTAEDSPGAGTLTDGSNAVPQPRSAFVPQPSTLPPSGRRASVAVMHNYFEPHPSPYHRGVTAASDVPTPSTACTADHTPSWARGGNVSRRPSSSYSPIVRSDCQTQTQTEPLENRGCQTVESSLQQCERGVQTSEDDIPTW